MSRSTWASILLIGAAFGLVVYLFFGRPLPEWAVSDALQTQARLEQLTTEVDQEQARIDALVKEDPDYLAERPEVKAARQRLAEREQRLEAMRQKYADQVKPLVEEDDYADREELLGALTPLNADLQALLAGGDVGAAAEVQRLLEYKRDHARLLSGARDAARDVAGIANDPVLESGLETASTQYPEAREKLQAKRDQLVAGAAQVQADLARLDELAAETPVDYAATGALADRVATTARTLQAQKAALASDFVELARSETKILTDMKAEGGKFYHQYKIIENGTERETGWLEVDAATYRQNEDNLGMAIYSKPEGVLAEDAVTVASPPGYAYVGNPRYGRWETSGGTSFWVFYGQYALMRDLLWGRGYYRPVYRGDYDDWRTARRSGRPYYGRNNEYGTQGSTTRSRYAGSRYMSDRAARRATAPRSGTPSGTQRSGGTFRTSRSRSGSFGRGGK